MNKALSGIAALAIGSLLCASGAAVAVAGATTTAEVAVDQNAAQQVQQVHDQLQAAAKADDVSGIRTALTHMSSVLAPLLSPTARNAFRPETIDNASQAQSQGNELQQKLAQAPQPPKPDFSAIKEFLNNLKTQIKDLLAKLKATITSMVNSAKPSTPASTPA